MFFYFIFVIEVNLRLVSERGKILQLNSRSIFQMEGAMSSEAVQCPICSKDFVPTAIEAHASKCLFLNESSKKQTQTFLKRSNSVQTKSKSPLAKKAKQQPAANNKKASSKQPFVTPDKRESPERIVDNNVRWAYFVAGELLILIIISTI